jgi:tetratricopeptide (TPR) repeat protein
MAQPLPTELHLALIERELRFDNLEAFEQALAEARAAAADRPNADTLFRAGLLLCCRSAWSEALPLLDRAIASRGEFIPAYAERGLLYGINQQYAEGMRDLAYAINADPAYHRSWAYRAALHVQRSMWGDVLEDAARSIRRAPAYAPPYKLRGMGFQVLNQPALALEAMRAYLEYCPEAPDAAQIRRTIERLEQEPAEQPRPKGWLARLLGR